MNRRHTISFMHALEGIGYAIRTQPNFVIHLLISLVVIAVGWWLQITGAEWLLVAVVIAFGLVIEMLNTSIEAVVDLVTDEIKPLAKIAKDCASGAMLVYALGASVVGLLIFLPKLWLFF
ncbi:MAG: diacylglycerol kinase family protein [bacterium]|nr:diacylglycerol kinase family protein [bacterium]